MLYAMLDVLWLVLTTVRAVVRTRQDLALENAFALRVPEPRNEFGAEDVDLPVQQTAPVRHLLLLAGQLVDELLQILVGESREVGQRFHESLSPGTPGLEIAECQAEL